MVLDLRLERIKCFGSVLFQIPQNLPCSVTLQPGPEDTGKVTHTDHEHHSLGGGTKDLIEFQSFSLVFTASLSSDT